MRMLIGIVVSVVVLAAGVTLFLNRPEFGRLPRGKRLERIRQSPNFKNERFQNRLPTPLLTSGNSRATTMLRFLFSSKEGLRPDAPIPAVKTDLKSIPRDSNFLVWFGHSSYYIQTDGRRILVDPVFCKAAPVGFVNKPFAGTDIYSPDDISEVDYLLITHDHWDHLDYGTVTALRKRVRKVVCPLGVGEHFEYWGYDPDRIVEMDWKDDAELDSGFTVYCLPARHFSGRGLRSDRTLWASFLIKAPSQTIYMGGDGGYGTHLAQIGARFPDIDLAILENGQYNADWRYIHLMPEYLQQAVRDLGPRKVMTVHHSKYALARHHWDEPLANERALGGDDSVRLVVPQIGEVVQF